MLLDCESCVCVSAGSCRSEGRRGPAWYCWIYCKFDLVKLHPIPSLGLCSVSMVYRMLCHMKQEAVSMVISDRDHGTKSNNESCDMLTSTLSFISRVLLERGALLGRLVLLASQDHLAAWALLGRWERKASQ